MLMLVFFSPPVRMLRASCRDVFARPLKDLALQVVCAAVLFFPLFCAFLAHSSGLLFNKGGYNEARVWADQLSSLRATSAMHHPRYMLRRMM